MSLGSIFRGLAISAAPLALAIACSCPPESAGARADAARACPEGTGTVQVGKLADPELKEASGLVVSRQPDLLWSHNDSGDTARVFALGTNGRARGILRIDNVVATDIEDMGTSAGPGGLTYLYLADIGDNTKARASVAIYRILEPSVGDTPLDEHTQAETMTFMYPDGPHDAETLLVDPKSSELYVVTKEKPGGHLFSLGRFVGGSSPLAKDVGIIPIEKATGGSFAADRSYVAIRGYGGMASVWSVGPTLSVESALRASACSVALGLDLQGETIAFDNDAKHLYTTSEGLAAPLHRTDLSP